MITDCGRYDHKIVVSVFREKPQEGCPFEVQNTINKKRQEQTSHR